MTVISMTPEQASDFCARFVAANPAAPEPVWNGSAMIVDDRFVSSANAIVAAGFAPSKEALRAYAANARFDKETSGVTVDGVTFPTDRETQSKFAAAVILSQINPAATFHWKLKNNQFVDLDAAKILAVASAAGAHVQACFAAEGATVTSINSGTITTKAQIDAEFAALA